MNNLIKLEMKKNSFSSYFLAVCFITIGSLFLLYTLALVPRIDSSPDVSMFLHYTNLAVLIGILQLCAFSILSATMHSKLVIEEYTGKRLYLLFSYPIKRNRVFSVKLVLSTMFTFISMLVSSLIVFGLFFMAESIIHIVPDTIDISLILFTLYIIVGFSVIASIVGIICLAIGFYKGSVKLTIIFSFIICAALSNTLGLIMNNSYVLPLAISVFLILGFIALIWLFNRVNNLEECI